MLQINLLTYKGRYMSINYRIANLYLQMVQIFLQMSLYLRELYRVTTSQGSDTCRYQHPPDILLTYDYIENRYLIIEKIQ